MDRGQPSRGAEARGGTDHDRRGRRGRGGGGRRAIREVRRGVVHGADVDTAHAPAARAGVQPVRVVVRCGRREGREEEDGFVCQACYFPSL